jgi:hypothetical protein
MDEKNRVNRAVWQAGAGLAIGAALGMIFGLMLFEDVVWGTLIGAVAGLGIGWWVARAQAA